MPDRDEPMKPEAYLPDMIEEGANPGWRVRVGVSRDEVMILAEAAESEAWFDSEVDMNACVQHQLSRQKRDERGG